MCGIAGLINLSNKVSDLSIFDKMVDIVKHRGPDGRGVYHYENVLLGHRRLSILDLSVNGKQPMEYLDNYVISFNGEIYNYIELKKELTLFGYSFKTNTDTEVIMAAFDYWGISCLDRFIGMWSFILLDKKNRKLFGSRDRFGIKPFYYTYLGNYLAFASEIKQFTVFPEWKSKANLTRLMDYLMSGITDHTNETLFQNVFQLRGGEYFEYDLNENTSSVNNWYVLKSKHKPYSGSFEDAKNQFKNLFYDSIRLQLRSDVKVGSCLSGGLDSSSIVCSLNEQLNYNKTEINQEVVSSCSNDPRYDEQYYIDLVVDSRKIIGHKVFPTSFNLIKKLDILIWHQDEPFVSSSTYAQYEVFKEAKANGLIVMLDGQGADEQLAGYTGFFYQQLVNFFINLRWFKLVKSLAGSKKYSGIPVIKNLFSMFKTFIIFVTPYFVFKFIRLLRRNIKKSNNSYTSLFTTKYIKDSQLYKYHSKRIGIYNESIRSLNFNSLPKLLHYEDRNSMAHSVESRVPFLDHRLVEFVLNLPDEFKLNESITKHILREALKDIIPNEIYSRYDKMSFYTSEETWIRENYSFFRNEVAESCKALKGLIDTDKTLMWFDEVLKSKKTFDYLFWKIINIGRWIKVFNVEISST
jgi:asparagine synthase (glutamine-hydrolysing)